MKPDILFLVTMFKNDKMPRVQVHKQFNRLCDFDEGRIIVYRDGGLSHHKIARCIDSAATTVMHICLVWNEEGKGTRKKSTGQTRRTIKLQERRLGEIAL